MIKNNNKGQSTIEFVLTFTSAVGFIFLFLKMAINYTNGYIVHHATYMASRAYLTNDAEKYPDPTGQEQDELAFKFADTVFKKNLPDGLIPGFDGKLVPNHPAAVNFPVFIGVRAEFHQAFSSGFVGGKENIVFRSESFLGREPTRAESSFQVCLAMKKITGADKCEIHMTLDDNGG